MNRDMKMEKVYYGLAQKWNCSESIFTDGENHFIHSEGESFFEMITFGSTICIYADDALFSFYQDNLSQEQAQNSMDGEMLYKIEKKLREYEYQLEGEHNRYLFCNEIDLPCPEGYQYRWFDSNTIKDLYENKKFKNALNYSRDSMAFGAYKDNELIALAGADDYLGEQLWQIGQDDK